MKTLDLIPYNDGKHFTVVMYPFEVDQAGFVEDFKAASTPECFEEASAFVITATHAMASAEDVPFDASWPMLQKRTMVQFSLHTGEILTGYCYELVCQAPSGMMYDAHCHFGFNEENKMATIHLEDEVKDLSLPREGGPQRTVHYSRPHILHND